LYKKITQGKVNIPSFVSDQARDIIKKILNTDTAKRFTVQQIMAHPWFSLSSNYAINIGIKLNSMTIPVYTIYYNFYLITILG